MTITVAVVAIDARTAEALVRKEDWENPDARVIWVGNAQERVHALGLPEGMTLFDVVVGMTFDKPAEDPAPPDIDAYNCPVTHLRRKGAHGPMTPMKGSPSDIAAIEAQHKDCQPETCIQYSIRGDPDDSIIGRVPCHVTIVLCRVSARSSRSGTRLSSTPGCQRSRRTWYTKLRSRRRPRRGPRLDEHLRRVIAAHDESRVTVQPPRQERDADGDEDG